MRGLETIPATRYNGWGPGSSLGYPSGPVCTMLVWDRGNAERGDRLGFAEALLRDTTSVKSFRTAWERAAVQPKRLG